MPGRFEQPHRAADDRQRIWRQTSESLVQIDPPAFVAGMDDQALAEQAYELIEKRGIAPRPHGVVQR